MISSHGSKGIYLHYHTATPRKKNNDVHLIRFVTVFSRFFPPLIRCQRLGTFFSFFGGVRVIVHVALGRLKQKSFSLGKKKGWHERLFLRQEVATLARCREKTEFRYDGRKFLLHEGVCGREKLRSYCGWESLGKSKFDGLGEIYCD